MTAMDIVNEQAEDDALWFIAESVQEAYFQQELRRLHEAIEREHCFLPPLITDAGCKE